jgi:endonuclease-3
MSKNDCTEGVGVILSRLYDEYGEPTYEGPDDLLGVLVQTILSQQTTRANCRRAFGELLDAFGGDWGRIEAAPRAQIEAAIACAGLAGQKSARIQALLARVHAERGEYSLEFLRECSARDARDYLTSFKGVGPKTAAFTLMYAAGMAVFPMDTHIFRICERLGWIDPAESSLRAHQTMEAAIPQGRHYSAHMVLVRHGREVCHARRPACEACPLSDACLFTDA